MKTMDCVMTRRSTRKFSPKPVEPEKLQTVLEAGRYAPSGGNSQTTHFLVIRNQEVLRKLAEMAQTAFASMEITPGLYRSIAASISAAKKDGYVFHYNAPVLILTANRRDYGNAIADCACALENMMLAANDLDLGSVWINQLKWLNDEPIILRYLMELGMKDDERVFGGLSLGYADSETGLPNRTALPRTGNTVTFID